MPPRKTVKAPVKPQRGRTKKEKPLKTPTLIRIPVSSKKIPERQSKEATPVIQKSNDKIELANEVVRYQFPQNTSLIQDPEVVEAIKPTNKISKKKPVLKRKRVNTQKCEKSPNTLPEPELKKPRRKFTPKKLQNDLPEENAIAIEEPPVQNVSAPKVKKTRATKPTAKATKAKRVKPAVQNKNCSKEIDTVVSQNIKNETMVKLPMNRKSGSKRKRKPNGIIDKEPKLQTEIKVNDANLIYNGHLDISRRRSLTSSELSWTKDISSSSATNVTMSSVSSKDFVCINNKLPILKLTNIDSQSCIDDNVSRNVIEYPLEKLIDDVDMISPLRDFSSSSSKSSIMSHSPQKGPSNCQRQLDLDSTTSKHLTFLKMFFSRKKLTDIEMIHWVGEDEHSTHPLAINIRNKYFSDKYLKQEMKILNSFSNVLGDELEMNEEIQKETSHNGIQTNNRKEDRGIESNSNNIHKDSEHNFNDHEYNPQDKSNLFNKQMYTSLDNDDDALSLYAESITGMDSSIRTNHHKFEEYIPQPVGDPIFKSPKLITYKPTKIYKTPDRELENNISPVCMKQNADSTSYKDSHNNHEETAIIYEDRTGDTEKRPEAYSLELDVTPCVPVKSKLFKGVCFYNLVFNCKQKYCKFPHKIIEIDEIKKRLGCLKVNSLKSEFALITVYPDLQHRYGKCFVQEGIRRDLKQIVVEMALHFVMKPSKENSLVIEVLEETLLYLNSVDLRQCRHLLLFCIKDKKVLCDLFMETIAQSQNFSRFRSVFINLTDFVFEAKRTLDIKEALNVLERVCILPYEEGLARALIKIFKITDAKIFFLPLVASFETQLSNCNMDLYKEFCCLKDICLAKLPLNTSLICPPANEANTSVGYAEKNVRYSPDTTNFDNMNKTPMEPMFRRTINNVNSGHNSTSSSTNYSEDKLKKKFNFNSWRHRSILPRFIKHTQQVMRPPLRPPFMRRSEGFDPGPSNYQRRPRPSFH